MKTLSPRPRVKAAPASRKVSPLVEQFEARQLMTSNLCSPTAGLGFLAGSVTTDGASQTALPCVTVQLYKAGSTSPIASQTTDIHGQYLFTGLKPGDYVIKEVVPKGYT